MSALLETRVRLRELLPRPLVDLTLDYRHDCQLAPSAAKVRCSFVKVMLEIEVEVARRDYVFMMICGANHGRSMEFINWMYLSKIIATFGYGKGNR